jgi:arabinan endo-1,5-alpha-L-arabinosidase
MVMHQSGIKTKTLINMKRIGIIFTAAALLALSVIPSCGGNGKSSDNDLTATSYTNPVIDHNCPDPTIIDDRERTGYFYAYSTSNGNTNLPVYRSKDMVTWESVGDGLPSDWKPWAEGGRLWAPDINYVDGKYILYYAMGVWGNMELSASGVAVADKPEGPFQDKGMVVSYQNTGVGNSIDPMLFIDDDGTKYLYWGSLGNTSGIWVIELGDDCLSIKDGAEPVKVGATNMEGTYVIKRDGYYYMFNSKGSCCEGSNSTYHIVVSRSKSPKGPFSGPEGKSLLDSDYANVILSSSPDSTFIGPGHDAQIITDDAGEDWMAYHSYWKGNSYKGRCMLIDKIIWEDGWPAFTAKNPTLSGEGPKWKK